MAHTLKWHEFAGVPLPGLALEKFLGTLSYMQGIYSKAQAHQVALTLVAWKVGVVYGGGWTACGVCGVRRVCGWALA